MPFTVLGLPLHALVLHATVVLLPLTTLLLALCAFSASVRRRAGVLLPLAGLTCAVLVPVTTQSGEQLQHRLPSTPAIAAHARAGDQLLPWSFALALVCVAVYVVGRRAARTSTGRRGLPARSLLSIGLAAVATVVAVGTLVETAYIGHLGATATWSYVKDLPPQGAAAP